MLRLVPREAVEFRLTSPEVQRKPVQGNLPLGTGASPSKGQVHPIATRQYLITDFAANDLRPDAVRFYDGNYRSTLRQMITLVVATEAPIYEDVLVERIARAHGFQRSGATFTRSSAM